MFDEIALSLNLGCKILPGPIVVGRFGQNQAKSVVAISQTLDKLVVHNPSLTVQGNCANLLLETNDSRAGDIDDGGDRSISQLGESTANSSVYYIAIKDVIRTVAVANFKNIVSPGALANLLQHSTTDQGSAQTASDNGPNLKNLTNFAGDIQRNPSQSAGQFQRDLLLIGCSNSILLYDAFSQSSLLSISTPTSVSAITTGSRLEAPEAGGNCWPIICGGLHRMYALKLDGSPTTVNGGNIQFNNKFNVEISSERSVGDTINCLAQGTLNGLDLVLTGSLEQKIRIYLLDSFEQNIQPCKLTIEELATINCLCPINTCNSLAGANVSSYHHPSPPSKPAHGPSSLLPSVQGSSEPEMQASALDGAGEQMNYFAYGLENGLIGVYRLLFSRHSAAAQKGLTAAAAALTSERVWRHKCKHSPLAVLMFDLDGDGLDELVVGFRSSRLEVRSPFTGQLLAATRCFKADRLAGLTVIDYHNDGNLTLLACSTAGSLVGFRPRVCRPRRALQGYNLPATRGVDSDLLLDEPAIGNGAMSNHDSLDWQTNANAFGATNLKTIEEESQNFKQDPSSVNMKSTTVFSSAGATDLHIETQNDDTKAGKCFARQSNELLLRISALRNEQTELERKACQIYHKSLQHATEFYPTDVGIAHRWDFDSNKAHLRLTIVISSNLEEVKLIEFEDKSGNLLPKAHLLMQPAEFIEQPDRDSPPDNKRSQMVVVPLRTGRDVESSLDVRIYCSRLLRPKTTGTNAAESVGANSLTRVYRKSIDVPRFSMITFVPFLDANDRQNNPDSKTKEEPENAGKKQRISVVFKLKDCSKLAQIWDWLYKSFLCFQFGQLIESSGGGGNKSPLWYQNSPNSTAGNISSSSLSANNVTAANNMERNNPMIDGDDAESFELNLLDLRHTLERIASVDVKDATRLGGSHEDSSSTVDSLEEASQSSKLLKLASILTVAYSNGLLKFASENSDLLMALVQSLVIDRLQLQPVATTSSEYLSGPFAATSAPANGSDEVHGRDKLAYEQEPELIMADANVEPIVNELERLTSSSRQLEESERRIQTELYESADYTNTLMQQFTNANELNEFTIAKELLNELFMMLNGTQNSARAQCLNNRSRSELSKQINELKEKLTFLMSNFI